MKSKEGNLKEITPNDLLALVRDNENAAMFPGLLTKSLPRPGRRSQHAMRRHSLSTSALPHQGESFRALSHESPMTPNSATISSHHHHQVSEDAFELSIIADELKGEEFQKAMSEGKLEKCEEILDLKSISRMYP